MRNQAASVGCLVGLVERPDEGLEHVPRTLLHDWRLRPEHEPYAPNGRIADIAATPSVDGVDDVVTREIGNGLSDVGYLWLLAVPVRQTARVTG